MELIAKPVFAKLEAERDMFLELRKQVNQTVTTLEKKRRWLITLKAIVFPSLYLATYIAALLYGSNVYILYTCYALLAFLLEINFLNLTHDAVHNTLFSRKWINSLYAYFLDIIGANSYIFKIRHIRLHHNYPNVMGWDSDFEQSPMARVFPHGEYSKMHRYQYIYLPLLYPLYLFNWLFIRDFKDFFKKNTIVWKINTIPTIEYGKLFFFKALFVFNFIILPKMVLHVTWGEIITAFLIMMFTASSTSLIFLLSPHATPESEFPLPDNKGQLPDTWFRHQLATTNDVENDNWFTRFFLGSFNYHIAHHVFPYVNHVYYPEVTQQIQAFAKKNNLPYRSFPLWRSLYNHFRLLKANAVAENIFEETM
ncbi:fatty acid desaturase [Ginsengibacter hankyongi]|uniref:Fatty acid desaturase n=1 Tax=Ginsengibacter hankyongi TaxID=2607284 RepID=A0A5J5IMC7_9BACT|nr:fatty acid desaturase [Ginsengibacter hankyongi]KAA9041237.1 fatty acid desaturase [Ginsengibacter hankyongi]